MSYEIMTTYNKASDGEQLSFLGRPFLNDDAILDGSTADFGVTLGGMDMEIWESRATFPYTRVLEVYPHDGKDVPVSVYVKTTCEEISQILPGVIHAALIARDSWAISR